MSNVKVVTVDESTSSAAFLEQLAGGQCLRILEEVAEEFRHPESYYMFLKKSDEIICIDKYSWDTWQMKISYLPASVFYFLYNLKDNKVALPHVKEVLKILWNLSSDYTLFDKITKSVVIKSKKKASNLLGLDITTL